MIPSLLHRSVRIRITLATLLVAFVASLTTAAPAPRPNFLIIIADDLNWRDLGCTGSPDVKTPNIDRLAKESMTLRAMFTPAPTCSPLRHDAMPPAPS